MEAMRSSAAFSITGPMSLMKRRIFERGGGSHHHADQPAHRGADPVVARHPNCVNIALIAAM